MRKAVVGKGWDEYQRRMNMIEREMTKKIAALAGRWDDKHSIHILATLQDVVNAMHEAANSHGLIDIQVTIWRQAALIEDAPHPDTEPPKMHVHQDEFPF